MGTYLQWFSMIHFHFSHLQHWDLFTSIMVMIFLVLVGVFAAILNQQMSLKPVARRILHTLMYFCICTKTVGPIYKKNIEIWLQWPALLQSNPRRNITFRFRFGALFWKLTQESACRVRSLTGVSGVSGASTAEHWASVSPTPRVRSLREWIQKSDLYYIIHREEEKREKLAWTVVWKDTFKKSQVLSFFLSIFLSFFLSL